MFGRLLKSPLVDTNYIMILINKFRYPSRSHRVELSKIKLAGEQALWWGRAKKGPGAKRGGGRGERGRKRERESLLTD